MALDLCLPSLVAAIPVRTRLTTNCIPRNWEDICKALIVRNGSNKSSIVVLLYAVPCKSINLLGVFPSCCITTCNLNGFLFGFHVMDKHKIVQSEIVIF